MSSAKIDDTAASEPEIAHKIDLRKLDYSPTRNPLIEPQMVNVKKKWVKSGSAEVLLNPKSGEIAQGSVISTLKKVDDAHFVKVFASGVIAAFELSRPASRVFQLVLRHYEATPLTGGYADHVSLYHYEQPVEIDGKKKKIAMLNDQALDMSIKTYQRGLAELLEKNFISPKQPSVFWVNPSLFFKGDRVKFVTEYERVRAPSITGELA